MRWHDLLFAHWPVPAADLQRALPAGLQLDRFNGTAWLGVVPFRMTGVRPRWIRALPWFSAFAELNVRTYVRVGGKPGVYFFSLDAANGLAVEVARRWYHLPYFRARMECRDHGGHIAYFSRRTHRGAPPAEFLATYWPTGEVFQPVRGTLEYFLTERYCLYTTGAGSKVCRAEIHHAPWPLQPAAARIQANSMAAAHGFRLPDVSPVLYFARRLDVVAWRLKPIASTDAG
jgi:hypothetical protein